MTHTFKALMGVIKSRFDKTQKAMFCKKGFVVKRRANYR